MLDLCLEALIEVLKAAVLIDTIYGTDAVSVSHTIYLWRGFNFIVSLSVYMISVSSYNNFFLYAL